MFKCVIEDSRSLARCTVSTLLTYLLTYLLTGAPLLHQAIVHTPPSARRQRDYLVEFEDENEPTGRGEATNVPQKYVLPIPDYAR